MVSMKEIAKKCNVSVASVSKALNGYSDISEETRKMILKTASEMGYLPNSSARTLKTKRSYNIGVMFVDEAASGLTHDYFNHVLESFKRTAEERGYDITFTSGKISGQKLSYYEHCRYRGVDGVVIACVDFYADEVQELIRSEIPVVTIDHVFDGNIAVVSNNSQGMEELVTYIYNQGHRRIAYIHGDNTSVTRMRLSGFIGLYSGWEWRYRMLTLKNVRTEMQIALQRLRGNCWIFPILQPVFFIRMIMLR